MSQPRPPSQPLSLQELVQGHWWWLRLLVREGGLWILFAPYPLEVLSRCLLKGRSWAKYSNPWSTLALVLAAQAAWAPVQVADPTAAHQVFAGLVFTGVALITGLMGIATALPGPSLLEHVLRKRPGALVNLVRPYLAALVFGLVSAGVLLAWSVLGMAASVLGRFVGVYFAWFGALLILEAMFFALQNFVMGLYYLSVTPAAGAQPAQEPLPNPPSPSASPRAAATLDHPTSA